MKWLIPVASIPMATPGCGPGAAGRYSSAGPAQPPGPETVNVSGITSSYCSVTGRGIDDLGALMPADAIAPVPRCLRHESRCERLPRRKNGGLLLLLGCCCV